MMATATAATAAATTTQPSPAATNVALDRTPGRDRVSHPSESLEGAWTLGGLDCWDEVHAPSPWPELPASHTAPLSAGRSPMSRSTPWLARLRERWDDVRTVAQAESALAGAVRASSGIDSTARLTIQDHALPSDQSLDDAIETEWRSGTAAQLVLIVERPDSLISRQPTLLSPIRPLHLDELFAAAASTAGSATPDSLSLASARSSPTEASTVSSDGGSSVGVRLRMDAVLRDLAICHTMVCGTDLITEAALVRLQPVLRAMAELTFYDERAVEPEERINERRLLLHRRGAVLPMLIDLISRIPVERFRSGSEALVQCVTNMLRHRTIKAEVMDAVLTGSGRLGGLLHALHIHLAMGGLLDCNIVIKAFRCLRTYLWADGRPPTLDAVRATLQAGLVDMAIRACVRHEAHTFTLARVLDVLEALVQADVSGVGVIQRVQTVPTMIALLHRGAGTAMSHTSEDLRRKRRSSDAEVVQQHCASIGRVIGMWAV